MKKIFIADPALVNCHGHHFAVTDTFSRVVEKAGLKPIWLINKNFKEEEALAGRKNITLIRCFSTGTYDAYKQNKPDAKSTEAIESLSSSKNRLGSVLVTLAKSVKKILPEASYLRMRQLYLAQNEPISRSATDDSSQNKHTITDSSSKNLFDALKSFELDPNDMVFFHTCDAETYRDIVELFTNHAQVSDWSLLPTFHCSTPYDEDVMPHNKRVVPCWQSISRMKALGLLDKRVYLYAENELLSDHLSDFFSNKVEPLYIPLEVPSSTVKLEREFETVTFSYLGAARTEKGFPDIANSVIRLLESDSTAPVQFAIQITPQIVGYSPDVKKAVERLKLIQDKRLRLIDGVQSSLEYSELLKHSDAIFLYYDPDRYRVRSSGVVLEALSESKVLITSKDCFPAFVAGGSGVQVSSEVEIVEAINKIARNIEAYSAKAVTRKDEFFEDFRSESFLQLISNEGYNRALISRESKLSENSSAPLKSQQQAANLIGR